MSQLASFVYIKSSDVPLLGFWSKPKRRWFRRPVSKFCEYLKAHALREAVFEEADGVYVAIVFAWIHFQDEGLLRDMDPVVETVRTRIGGSHWLVQFSDQPSMALLNNRVEEEDWPALLSKLGVDTGEEFEWRSFESARRCVRDRISDLKEREALLVSVG